MATLKCMQPQTASTIAIVDVNGNVTGEVVPCSRPSFFAKVKRRRYSKLEVCLLVVSLVLLVALILTAVLMPLYKTKPARGGLTGEASDRDGILSLAQILGNMDNTVDPCEDFYQYACGGWLKKTHIEGNDGYAFSFKEVWKENKRKLREILENMEIKANYSGNPVILKVFDMYSSCMNKLGIEIFGDSVLRALLLELGVFNITKNHEWHQVVVKVKRKLGIDTFFSLQVMDDLKNSSIRRIVIREVSLGLNQMYYTANSFSQEMKIRRENYLEYMTDLMAIVTSQNRSFVKQEMRKVFDLETEIAKTQLPPDQRQDFTLIYNLVPIQRLTNMTSQFDWLSFFRSLTLGTGYLLKPDEKLLISSPKMIQDILILLNTTDSRVISNYIAWKIVTNLIDILPERYGQASRKLSNSDSQVATPRWTTCVQATAGYLPLAVTFLFTEHALPKDTVDKSMKLINYVKKTFLELIPNQSWMDKKTRDGAIDKVEAIIYHIAFPDNITSATSLKFTNPKFNMSKTSYFVTSIDVKSFKFMEQFKSLKTPVDRKESDVDDPVKPTTYYYPTRNKIEVSAGMLSNPLYYTKNYKSLNFGTLGMAVGHEITHAFDLRGYKFDKNGHQQSWMSSQSVGNLSEKTSCISAQYSKFRYKGYALNENPAKYGEAFSDIGGLKIAFEAYKQWKSDNGEEPIIAGVEITHDQLFFLSYAQMWCAKYKERVLIGRMQYGVYSPEMFRVRGTVVSSHDFADTFSCASGTAMNPKDKCKVW